MKKRHILVFLAATMLGSGAHAAQYTSPLANNEISITNATDMPLIIRAVRREAGSFGENTARWNSIGKNDAAFNRENFALSERTSMTRPFILRPGQSKRIMWLESWKFDLLFAPQGSDLAQRIGQQSMTVTKDQALSNLHEGYWGNVNAGTRIILYYIPSEAVKKQLLKSDAKQLMGRGQQTVAVGKVNMATIYQVKDKLNPAQAQAKEENFINTVRHVVGQ